MTNEDLKRFYPDNPNVSEPFDFVRTGKGGNITGYTKKFETATITSIGDTLCEALQCGDILVKNENGNKHTYIVSYKEDKTGMCLTYSDATVVETVSYDYTDGHWVYNSTDIGRI